MEPGFLVMGAHTPYAVWIRSGSSDGDAATTDGRRDRRRASWWARETVIALLTLMTTKLNPQATVTASAVGNNHRSPAPCAAGVERSAGDEGVDTGGSEPLSMDGDTSG